MNEKNNIENEETRRNSETSESNFDDEWHKEVMYKIQKEKAEQKKIDEEMADKLTQTLLEDEKMPINDFIEKCRKEWVNDIEISLKLIWNWYWKEIKNSNLSEDLKKSLFKFIDNIYSKYWYKAKDKDAFENLFFQIAQTIINEPDFSQNLFFEKIQQRLQKMEMKSPISFDFIKSTLGEKHLSFSLPYREIMHWDWSDSEDVLNNISFYDNSFGDDCKFPKWYNPHEVFEKWKSIGLWIDKIHERYTWEWVDVAIIDSPLAPHDDIKPLEHVKSWKQPHFHWSAVASILSWEQTGIVPNANLHYVESSSETDNRDIYDNLSQLKDKNIKVISMSFNLYQWWMAEKPEEKDKISWLVKEFSEKWTWVLSGDEFIKNFGILSKKDPMWNIDDFQNYQVTWPDQRTIDRRKELLNPNYKPKDKNEEYERNFTKEFYNNEEIDIENLIFINSGDRTVADPNSPSSYRHDAIWGTSWTIPAVAWYYALACQVDSNITPERFIQLARETAEIVNISDIPKDMNHVTQWRVPMNAKIKILNIQNLIQKIEEDKNK